MESILDILPIGVFVLDAQFRVAEVNSTLEQFFGIRREDLLGHDKRTLINEKIIDIFENGDKFGSRVLATYDNNTYMEHFLCHLLAGDDRQERWVEHTSQPIRTGIYRAGRVEIYTDVTERILAEQEIQWLTAQSMQLLEKEKSRIASNLHDGLGQSILAIKFSLENLLESLQRHGVSMEREKVELQKLIKWIEEMGYEISNISSNLMPSMLGPLGLEETLVWLIDQYSSLYALEINFQSLGMKVKRLPESLEIAIFRVVQESLNNIVKHASAHKVELRLLFSHPVIIVSIADDGIGFDPEDNREMGIGLKLMKRRILEMNGTIKITSEVQKGTTIRAEFPAPENNHEKN